VGDILTPGKDEARETRRRQEELINRQRQQESRRLSEATSEVSRRRFLGRRGGRSLLVATSPQGVVSNLGGSNAT
jgi:hypothetical protein